MPKLLPETQSSIITGEQGLASSKPTWQLSFMTVSVIVAKMQAIVVIFFLANTVHRVNEHSICSVPRCDLDRC